MLRSVFGWLRTHQSLGRWSLRCLPNAPWTININPIGRFRIRLRRDRRFWVRHPLQHERWVFGVLQKMIKPGDVVYDVGSNIGLYARFMVSVFGAGRVIGFEPMSDNRATLSANIQLGGIGDRVQIFPCALADHEGQELLQIDEIASGAAVLDRVSGGQACESHRQYGLPPKTESVAVTTLDRIVREEALPLPAVMKVDVEGAEALVFRGGMNTIRKSMPKLVIELHGPDTARAMLPLLHELGYHVWARGWLEASQQATYARVGPDAARNATDPYEFHFLIASPHEGEFDAEIATYAD